MFSFAIYLLLSFTYPVALLIEIKSKAIPVTGREGP
jgi:hypothetical protein